MNSSSEKSGSERRRFERVDVAFAAQVRVSDHKGKPLGTLRQISRGGIMLEPATDKPFKAGKKHKMTIADESEGIRFQVNAVVRYADARKVGFEFLDLDADSAVDVGILIGKYYGSETVKK